MRGQKPDEQEDGCDERDRRNRADENSEDTIEGTPSGAVADDGGDEQHHNQTRQKPGRPDDERPGQGQINSAHRQQREQGLPTRFGFINLIRRTGHSLAYSKDSEDREKEPEFLTEGNQGNEELREYHFRTFQFLSFSSLAFVKLSILLFQPFSLSDFSFSDFLQTC